jgi:CRP-like cAMP-binding protein
MTFFIAISVVFGASMAIIYLVRQAVFKSGTSKHNLSNSEKEAYYISSLPFDICEYFFILVLWIPSTLENSPTWCGNWFRKEHWFYCCYKEHLDYDKSKLHRNKSLTNATGSNDIMESSKSFQMKKNGSKSTLRLHSRLESVTNLKKLIETEESQEAVHQTNGIEANEKDMGGKKVSLNLFHTNDSNEKIDELKAHILRPSNNSSIIKNNKKQISHAHQNLYNDQDNHDPEISFGRKKVLQKANSVDNSNGEDSSSTILNFLKTVSMFSHLEDVQFERLVECVTHVKYKKGTVIIQQGDIGKQMFMIQKGTVFASVANKENYKNSGGFNQGSSSCTKTPADNRSTKELIQANSSSHMVEGGQPDYHCLTCNMVFDSSNDLTKHYQNIVDDRKLLINGFAITMDRKDKYLYVSRDYKQLCWCDGNSVLDMHDLNNHPHRIDMPSIQKVESFSKSSIKLTLKEGDKEVQHTLTWEDKDERDDNFDRLKRFTFYGRKHVEDDPVDLYNKSLQKISPKGKFRSLESLESIDDGAVNNGLTKQLSRPKLSAAESFRNTEVTLEGVVAAKMGEGEVFGELAILSGRVRGASCTAMTDVEALVLDGVDLEDVMAQGSSSGKKSFGVQLKYSSRIDAVTLMRYAHDVKVCMDAVDDEMLLREEQEMMLKLGQDKESKNVAKQNASSIESIAPAKFKANVLKSTNKNERERRKSGVSIFQDKNAKKFNNALSLGPAAKRDSMSTSIAYAPEFLMETKSREDSVSSPVTTSEDVEDRPKQLSGGNKSEDENEVSDGEEDIVITTTELRASMKNVPNNLSSLTSKEPGGGKKEEKEVFETKHVDLPTSKKANLKWKKLQGAVARRKQAMNVLDIIHGKMMKNEFAYEWDEISGNNPRKGVKKESLSNPELNTFDNSYFSEERNRRNGTGMTRKSNLGVNWDDSVVNDLANFNEFKEMILVSQAADVQLDFMRRICPEYTGRQTLQELVIFLTDIFDDECYVTLSIPILNKGRKYVLKMSTSSGGGCDVKEQNMGGLSEWILDTGKSVSTNNVIDGNQYYDPKLDYIPQAITKPHTSDDYKGYFGFFLSPFDANEEEKMCIVVGLRLMRQLLPAEEAMVRGLTLTAVNGISFQQFGACAQINSVLNSADLNRHVRSKIMFIEHGQELFSEGDLSSQGGCCSFGSSSRPILHMRMRLVTGQCQSLHPGYVGDTTDRQISMKELVLKENEITGNDGKNLKRTATSMRFTILEWLEVEHINIKHLPQDARAIFELVDPCCKCKQCKDRNGHVYGWSSCPLFNYAKCFVRGVERMRMYPGKPPRELILQAEASEMDKIELDENDYHVSIFLFLFFLSFFLSFSFK